MSGHLAIWPSGDQILVILNWCADRLVGQFSHRLPTSLPGAVVCVSSHEGQNVVRFPDPHYVVSRGTWLGIAWRTGLCITWWLWWWLNLVEPSQGGPTMIMILLMMMMTSWWWKFYRGTIPRSQDDPTWRGLWSLVLPSLITVHWYHTIPCHTLITELPSSYNHSHLPVGQSHFGAPLFWQMRALCFSWYQIRCTATSCNQLWNHPSGTDLGWLSIQGPQTKCLVSALTSNDILMSLSLSWNKAFISNARSLSRNNTFCYHCAAQGYIKVNKSNLVLIYFIIFAKTLIF